MMLRIIFTGLATCVLLLAAGVRFAREDAQQSVREELGSALERAIESAKEALPRPPQPRVAGQTALEPAPEVAASLPPPAASQAAPPPASKPLPPPAPPASKPLPPPAPPASKPLPPPAPPAAAPPAHEAEIVTEESISPLWSAPFVEAPEARLEGTREGDPERQAPLVAAAPSQGVVAEPSQDEWAGLIRRMLAIYERVGVVE